MFGWQCFGIQTLKISKFKSGLYDDRPVHTDKIGSMNRVYRIVFIEGCWIVLNTHIEMVSIRDNVSNGAVLLS